MSVLLETTFGDITIDLWVGDCPENSKNFLKLCKLKYYNNSYFWEIRKNFLTRVHNPGMSATTIYK